MVLNALIAPKLTLAGSVLPSRRIVYSQRGIVYKQSYIDFQVWTSVVLYKTFGRNSRFNMNHLIVLNQDLDSTFELGEKEAGMCLANN